MNPSFSARPPPIQMESPNAYGGLLWDRFTVHYTPKHGSWLNQAEIETSLFSRRCLGRRRIPSLAELQQEAQA